MATYTWSIPTGNQITGSTKIKDTDNYLANTVDDLVDYVNSEGVHTGQGLAYDLVTKGTSQTLTGQKTFTQPIIASGGVTGNVTGTLTGSITGNSATATKLATARTFTIAGGLSASASFDGSADVTLTVGQTIPSGVILMWSGSVGSIPNGWYLCNGSNGTPNLLDRFVIGAGSGYGVGATGGSKDATLVSHNHSVSGTTSTDGNHQHRHQAAGLYSSYWQGYATAYGNYGGGTPDDQCVILQTEANGSHSHTVSGTTSTSGSSATNANLPPYYALCFIMKA